MPLDSTNITIEPVSFDTDNKAKFVTRQNSANRDYVIINKYFCRGKKYMLGITSPGGFRGNTVAFARTCAPTILWVCDWSASEENSMPLIPDPFNTVDKNWVLLDVNLQLKNIKLIADGVAPVYRWSGTYYFGQKNPNPTYFPNFNVPLPSYLEDVFTRTIPPGQLKRSLIDKGENIGGFLTSRSGDSGGGGLGPIQRIVP
jgi:hypothetical protein